MQLTEGQVGVVTGGASGIGLALAERLAQEGLRIVLADVEEAALAAAAEVVGDHGVDVHTIRIDVSQEAEVQALATATLERFGAVHVVCNNAGVSARADPWFGPVSSWEWVMGVNFWGVVHGCRAFLPHLVEGGYIVNTASIAGLWPEFAPSYDASKHAVIAMSEHLYHTVHSVGLPIGVSVLCPGWVHTRIVDADRNWPASLGPKPDDDPAAVVTLPYYERAIAEGRTPASAADAVADAIAADRFWVIPHQDFFDLCIGRWATIAQRANPQPPERMPGMPPRAQLLAEVSAALGLPLPT